MDWNSHFTFEVAAAFNHRSDGFH